MPWKCEHGHVHGIEPDPCWTCQLERSNRDLNDENERLKQQLREADEQCHQQVADAVRSRDEGTMEFVSRSRTLRDALVRCSSVGWPVDVQQAFSRWQRLLDGLMVVPPAREMDEEIPAGSFRLPIGPNKFFED
jgi:cell division septum initiation protein DivIVA